jgi:hypothetical protein
VADIQHVPDNIPAGSGAPFKPHSLSAETWQNLPLLALQSSSEVAADGEVQLHTLQAAYERERNSAAASQLQVVGLEEQLASLQEKQEEVLVLREQLADAMAHAKQTAEPRSAETEQKKHAGNALLRVAALQEELANLSTEVLKAKTTAEAESARAASALAQLEAVQHQLAIVTALQSYRTESRLRPQDGGIVDGTPLNSLRGAHSAEQGSKLPPSPKMDLDSSVEQRQVPLRSVRSDKSNRATTDKSRQASISIRGKPLAGPVSKTAAAPARSLEPDVSRLTRPRNEPRSQSLRSVGKPPQRASQPPHVLAQDTRNRRDPGALSLPGDLLPDSRLW